ncbi:MAG TPA: hypothetical protein VKT82_19705 [Ktedonobacterales bacterium]|nr:hypothetical protein [Ktedonobacterales bacterium]
MSQRVDLDHQHSYQAPSEANGALYQGQQVHPLVPGGMPAPLFVPIKPGESSTSRHRLILALCSLGALAVAVIAFVSALETWPNSAIPLYALLGLGMVCFTIVCINISFNLRR